MKRFLLVLPALLIACGTPQEQCIAAGTRDLRTVEKLIATAEGNLRRGYAIEEKTERFRTFTPCVAPPPPPPPEGSPPPPPPQVMMCPDTETRIVREPVAIDLEAEARKLQQLKAKRKELLRAAEKVAEACRAEFPE